MQNTLCDIPNYEGFYKINKNGEVYSVKTGIFLKGEVDKFGYKKVRLYKNTESKKIFVHRLVLITFSPNENYKNLVVNHKDGIKLNNKLENLEWCTVAENNKHCREFIGIRYKKGSHHRDAILNEEIVYKILNDPCSLMEAERKYNYDRRNIFRIRKGRIWKHVYNQYLEEKGTLPKYKNSRITSS